MSDAPDGAFRCARCGRSDGALTAPPIPGPTGVEIAQRVCGACWEEWRQAEVMVINELRLNFMDPASQKILTRHMREFLGLETGEPSAG